MKRIIASLVLCFALTAHSTEPVLVAQLPVTYMAGLGERTVTAPNGNPCSVGVVLLGTFNGAPNAQLRGFRVIHGTALRTICGEPGRFAAVCVAPQTGQKLWIYVRSGNASGLFSASAWTLPAPSAPFDVMFDEMFLSATAINEAVKGEVTANTLTLAK